MIKSKKIYVLFNTVNRGIYHCHWGEFEKHVKGVSKADYKGYKNADLARRAYDEYQKNNID